VRLRLRAPGGVPAAVAEHALGEDHEGLLHGLEVGVPAEAVERLRELAREPRSQLVGDLEAQERPPRR
jgi:hypothetical protein